MAISRNVNQAGREIQEVLSDRQPTALGFAAVAGGGGAIAAQEVAQQVLSALGRPIEPTSPANLGISSLSKMVVAVVFGAVAARLGRGVGFLLAAVAGFGALVSAGVDLFDLVQRGGIPGLAPNMNSGSRGGSRTPARQRTDGGQPRSRSTAGGGGGNSGGAGGGGSYDEYGSYDD